MKNLFKRAVLYVSCILVSPLILLNILGKLVGKGAPAFILSSQCLSMAPGLPGDFLRRAFYMYSLSSVGRDAVISFGSIFSKRTAEIGNCVIIGAYCVIGNVRFGDHVLVASRVSLMSGKYQHGSALVSTTVCPDKGISIGSHTWIGEGAIVGANVGSGCIVAAGSIVMRDVPDGYMAAGNPAKLIRMGLVEKDEHLAGETGIVAE